MAIQFSPKYYKSHQSVIVPQERTTSAYWRQARECFWCSVVSHPVQQSTTQQSHDTEVNNCFLSLKTMQLPAVLAFFSALPYTFLSTLRTVKQVQRKTGTA